MVPDHVQQFHIDYYNRGEFGNGTWKQTFWRGLPLLKCPLDLWIYQELLHEIKPQLIIETGSAFGGSAVYMGDLLALFGPPGSGVISIDIKPFLNPMPQHPRVAFVTASSVTQETVNWVKAQTAGRSPVMVILDSDHSKGHVLAELQAYAPLVTVGSYLIVEDTNINGHPVYPTFGPGPKEALDEWLPRCGGAFVVDEAREKFMMTWNPGGFLKRVK
ncbi:MAG TPA: CmcI family methyltransferase [Tepidisphaeraceae bacterium]|nr:CmcI family methyltransferase [Tepidisphaeraceae bacterium]